MAERIAAVEVFPVGCALPRPVGDGQGLQPRRAATFVRVRTESGLHGWGEGGAPVPGAYLVERVIGPALVGLDPRDVDVVHERLTRLRPPRGTLGAVDIALWDLRGKIAGESVARLLGGARRSRVPAYASLHNYSESADCAEELAELVRDAKRQGFRALKLKIGGRAPAEDERYLRVAREVGGPEFELMADANQTYDLPLAVRMGRVLEELGYLWLEEPLPRADLVGYAQLRAKLDIAIAGGEGATGAADVQALLQHRAVDVTQPDVAGVGGITEARHLPRLAALWGASPTWHVWSSPLIQVATLHVLANQESWYPLSMAPRAAPLEVTTMPSPMRERLLIGAPAVEADGMVPVPDPEAGGRPGLGVEVDEAALREFALAV